MVRRMRPMLGTFVEVQAQGLHAEHAIDDAWAAIEQAQRDWSVQDPSSELSRLNAQPGRRVRVSGRTRRLLQLARGLMRRSQGLFDITVGGHLTALGVLPDHGVQWLPRGHADDIDIGPDGVLLRRPVRLTLDGIAKGYAVDLAVAALQRAGAGAGLINAGGDLRVFGDLTVPVHRRRADGGVGLIGGVRQAAVATSLVQAPGERDARWPALLLGPEGRGPAPGAWTVLALRAWRADALTKVAAACPAHARAQLIQQLGGCLIDDAALGSLQT